jgi:hypothetical protein
MADTKSKSYSRDTVVLTAKGEKYVKRNGEFVKVEFEHKLTPTSFNTVSLAGMKVSGEDYYVKKAVALGATKA